MLSSLLRFTLAIVVLGTLASPASAFVVVPILAESKFSTSIGPPVSINLGESFDAGLDIKSNIGTTRSITVNIQFDAALAHSTSVSVLPLIAGSTFSSITTGPGTIDFTYFVPPATPVSANAPLVAFDDFTRLLTMTFEGDALGAGKIKLFNYNVGDGQHVYASPKDFTVVPEPSGIVSGLMAALALAVCAWRKPGGRRLAVTVRCVSTVAALAWATSAFATGGIETYGEANVVPFSGPIVEIDRGESLAVGIDLSGSTRDWPYYYSNRASFRLNYDPAVLTLADFSPLPSIALSPFLTMSQGVGYLDFDYVTHPPQPDSPDLLISSPPTKLRILNVVFVGNQVGTSRIHVSALEVGYTRNFIQSHLDVEVVPEPATVVSAAAGVVCLAAFGARRRRKSRSIYSGA